MIRNVFKRGRVMAAGAVFAFALLATAATNLIGAQGAAHAQSSDCALNIVCNGLSGSTDAQYVSSFKSLYTKGTDGHYSDLKSVYNWMGASSSIVSGMNTTNTVLGTVNKNGTITVGGKTVGTAAVITARFTNGAGFTKVEGNVYARKTTTYEYYATRQAIVYMQNGKMVFFVETECGNAGKGTPVTPPTPPKPPVPTEVCSDLTFKKTTDDNTYSFTATGSATNTAITGFTFNFGDKATQTVPTTGKTATTTHKYTTPGTYTAFAAINTAAKNGVTSADCAVQVTIPQPDCKPGIPAGSPECAPTPPVTPVMTCDQLAFSAPTDTPQIVTFTVTATAQNATINSYQIDFGDGTTAYSGSKPSTTHTYPQVAKTYTAIATVTFTANGKQQTLGSDKCKVQVPVTVEMCTVPGKETIPASDTTQCVTPPVITPPVVTPPTVTPPTTLVNTGAGNVIGIFAGVSLAGAAMHYFLAKRRASLNA